MMILGLATNSLSAQYPITKVIRKDTVVIMLKSQADEINRVFAAQREKIEQTTETTIVLNTNIDSLYNSVAAKYNGLLFYHPIDSTLQLVDLRYHTWYVKRNGSIHLKSVPYRNRPQWEQDWRDNPEEMYMPTPFNLFDNIRKRYILNVQIVPKL